MNRTQVIGSSPNSPTEQSDIVGQLKWLEGCEGDVLPLYDGENMIGRNNFCEIVISAHVDSHNSVSDKHAIISHIDGIISVKDLRSLNGTFVKPTTSTSDFVRLKKNIHILQWDSQIKFGDVICQIMKRNIINTDFTQLFDMESYICQQERKTAIGHLEPELKEDHTEEDTVKQESSTEQGLVENIKENSLDAKGNVHTLVDEKVEGGEILNVMPSNHVIQLLPLTTKTSHSSFDIMGNDKQILNETSSMTDDEALIGGNKLDKSNANNIITGQCNSSGAVGFVSPVSNHVGSIHFAIDLPFSPIPLTEQDISMGNDVSDLSQDDDANSSVSVESVDLLAPVATDVAFNFDCTPETPIESMTKSRAILQPDDIDNDQRSEVNISKLKKESTLVVSPPATAVSATFRLHDSDTECDDDAVQEEDAERETSRQYSETELATEVEEPLEAVVDVVVEEEQINSLQKSVDDATSVVGSFKSEDAVVVNFSADLQVSLMHEKSTSFQDESRKVLVQSLETDINSEHAVVTVDEAIKGCQALEAESGGEQKDSSMATATSNEGDGYTQFPKKGRGRKRILSESGGVLPEIGSNGITNDVTGPTTSPAKKARVKGKRGEKAVEVVYAEPSPVVKSVPGSDASGVVQAQSAEVESEPPTVCGEALHSEDAISEINTSVAKADTQAAVATRRGRKPSGKKKEPSLAMGQSGEVPMDVQGLESSGVDKTDNIDAKKSLSVAVAATGVDATPLIEKPRGKGKRGKKVEEVDHEEPIKAEAAVGTKPIPEATERAAGLSDNEKDITGVADGSVSSSAGIIAAGKKTRGRGESRKNVVSAGAAKKSVDCSAEVQMTTSEVVGKSNDTKGRKRPLAPPEQITPIDAPLPSSAIVEADVTLTSPQSVLKRNRKEKILQSAEAEVGIASCLRLLFTGIEKEDKLAASIGATVIDNPADATYLITTLPLKRTPKLMVAINSGVSYIVSLSWLSDSSKAGKPIAIKSLDSSKYIIRDKEKEKLWGFSMPNTLSKSRGAGASVGVFSNISVFLTSKICGTTAPPLDQMREIIESGQGKLVDRLIASTGDSQQLVIVSNEAGLSELTDEEWVASQNGLGRGIYGIDFLFVAVLRQEIDFSVGLLAEFSDKKKFRPTGKLTGNQRPTRHR